MKYKIFSILILSLSLIFVSCSDDSSAGYDSNNSNNWNNMNNVNNTNNANNTNNGSNVNIGGVQDIGVFRQKVENGEILPSSMFDENGFFSEHYIDYPFGSCGENLCLNGMLGHGISVINDDYMNVLQIVIKSYVDPENYERPPTDFYVVLDVSGSMIYEQKLEFAKQGLLYMIDNIREEDRISLITYNSNVFYPWALSYLTSTAEKDELRGVISSLMPSGGTNIHSALDNAFSKIAQREDQSRYARIVFVSDGEPTAGNTNIEDIIAVASNNASSDVQLTSIGVGYDINYELMKELAMSGGNFYFIEDPSALSDIFVEELDFFSAPIAQDVSISVNATSEFYVGDAVGFPDWIQEGNGGFCDFSDMYIVSRTTNNVEDPHSRRGGGSALFIKLISQNDFRDLSNIFINFDYYDPINDKEVHQEVSVDQLAGDGVVPVDNYYSEEEMKKSFLMLNIYLGVKKSLQEFEYGNYKESYEVLSATIEHADTKNQDLQDDDIEADLLLMSQLLNNISIYYNSGYNDPDNCDEYGCDNNNGEVEYVDYGCSSTNTTSLPIILVILFPAAILLKKRLF
ncbi:MAG: VWA domain-containing protein [Deltaproteobacteria bacterium]|jgi:Ca-activated chloride channel family protein|nr:VWA domain-containing protein [Deltaproteobacteria bacterium]